MDYQELLAKYIEYVGQAEGTDFILIHDRRHEAGVEFTEEEWAELRALAQRIEDQRRADYSDVGTEDQE